KCVSYAVEGVADRVREAVHGSHSAETHEGRDQRVLDQVLTGLFCHQVLQKLLHISFSFVQNFLAGQSRPGLTVKGAFCSSCNARAKGCGSRMRVPTSRTRIGP